MAGPYNIDKFEYNGVTYNLVDNTVNKGTVRNVTLTGTAPLTVTDNSSNTETINKTVSLANGYGDTKNPYGSKNAKLILATPNGQAGTPSFRQLVTSDISDFPTSLPASDVPGWAKQPTRPTYALNEITGTDDLRSIEALTGTSGFLKKTATNNWTLDTNSYAPADNYVKTIQVNGQNVFSPGNDGQVNIVVAGGGGSGTIQDNTSDNKNYGILLTNDAYAQTQDVSGIIHKTANLTFNPNTGSNTGLLTLTGDAVISGTTTTKLDTAAINGYVMDDYGNFLHKRSNANDCFNLKSYGTDGTDRETTLKMYYDSGNVLTPGNITLETTEQNTALTITKSPSRYSATMGSRYLRFRDSGTDSASPATTGAVYGITFVNANGFYVGNNNIWTNGTGCSLTKSGITFRENASTAVELNVIQRTILDVSGTVKVSLTSGIYLAIVTHNNNTSDAQSGLYIIQCRSASDGNSSVRTIIAANNSTLSISHGTLTWKTTNTYRTLTLVKFSG